DALPIYGDGHREIEPAESDVGDAIENDHAIVELILLSGLSLQNSSARLACLDGDVRMRGGEAQRRAERVSALGQADFRRRLLILELIDDVLQRGIGSYVGGLHVDGAAATAAAGCRGPGDAAIAGRIGEGDDGQARVVMMNARGRSVSERLDGAVRGARCESPEIAG